MGQNLFSAPYLYLYQEFFFVGEYMNLNRMKKLAGLLTESTLNEQLDSVWEGIIWKYVYSVQEEYAMIAKQMSPLNGWKFIKATHDLPGDTDEWVKTTQDGRKFSLTFYPFWETNPVFACAISENGEPYKGQNESFKVSVSPSGDKQKDARKGIEYIQKVLNRPEFN